MNQRLLNLKPILDKWMEAKGFPVLDADEIERREGGFGERKIRSIKEALERPDTYPGRWFASGQTDDNFYHEPEYLYSLWWAATRFSSFSYRQIGALEFGHNHTFLDIGGSIFTATELLEYDAKHVYIYNFAGHQLDFAADYIKSFNLPITVGINLPEYLENSDVLIAKAYFEHFANVDEELNFYAAHERAKRFYVQNSFCQPAYGHYIPILINGELHTNEMRANVAFHYMMYRKYGWQLNESSLILKKLRVFWRQR